MKKILMLMVLFLVIAVPVAAANSTSGQGSGTQTQTQQQLMVSPSPTGSAVRNQNQVATQNQGEDQQLMVATKEQESMSTVSAQVLDLMQIKTTGEIGNQIRKIAEDQDSAQEEIQGNLDAIKSRGTLAKFFIGTDYKALKELTQQMEQNRLRIEELEQLKTNLYNQSDVTRVEQMVQALTDVNTSLQDRVNLEDNTISLFGWLIKLFVK